MPMPNYSTPPIIQQRTFCQSAYDLALKLGLNDLQAKLVAHRLTEDDLDFEAEDAPQQLEKIIFPKLKHLQKPSDLAQIDTAAKTIANAIEAEGKIVLSTDYDTDGVTSAWVATQALTTLFGVQPSRIEHIIGERKNGYGISDEVVDQILAIPTPVELVISADQGSSDEPRIARLAEHNIKVCVTDHHQIAEDGVPKSAVCTVNPQQDDCQYDKTVAGCFVIFLVMGHTRQELIRRGSIPKETPSMKSLSLNVALGTVADSVSLKSPNNRAIVRAGLAQINQLNNPSWQAIHSAYGNPHQPINAEFLGFQVATRINAASRVSDVTTAFKFLNSETTEEAAKFLEQLNQDNLERRDQQTSMLQQAETLAAQTHKKDNHTLTVRMTGNAGIQGIIASRLGEKYGVPTIAMTDLNDGTLAGSGRGIIANIDLRQAFQWMTDQQEDLFISMGGHAGAAGCMIPLEQYEMFSSLFEQAIRLQLNNKPPVPMIETDGSLPVHALNTDLLNQLNLLEPFGREWPQPMFSGRFKVMNIRAVGQTKTHLSLKLMPIGEREQRNKHLSCIQFNGLEENATQLPFTIGEEVECAYQPSLNTFQGISSLQLKIQTILKAKPAH